MENILINRTADMDDLLHFLLNDYELDSSDLSVSLKMAFEKYKNERVLDVDIGQDVWVITYDYNYSSQKLEGKILKCKVTKKLIKKKRTFTVREYPHPDPEHVYRYCGTFTKNSIGKTVFFSEEDAKKFLESKS